MTDNPKPARQLKLEIPADLKPTYANAAMVNQTFSEIIVDLIQVLPNDQRARVQQRVVLTPTNAKLILQALQQNLARYEEKHGEIKLPPRPQSLADQLFRGLGSDDESTDTTGGSSETD